MSGWRPDPIPTDGLVAVMAHELMRAKTTVVYQDADRVARDILRKTIPAIADLPEETLRSYGLSRLPGARS